MTSLRGLALLLDEEASNLETSVNRAIQVGARAGVRFLVDNTPVDSSQALSNWQATLGAPTAQFRGPYRPGSGGSTANASANIAANVANTVITRRKAGDPLYISNDAPYIVRLDDGWSAQSPGGFVQNSVQVIMFTIGRELSKNG